MRAAAIRTLHSAHQTRPGKNRSAAMLILALTRQHRRGRLRLRARRARLSISILQEDRVRSRKSPRLEAHPRPFLPTMTVDANAAQIVQVRCGAMMADEPAYWPVCPSLRSFRPLGFELSGKLRGHRAIAHRYAEVDLRRVAARLIRAPKPNVVAVDDVLLVRLG